VGLKESGEQRGGGEKYNEITKHEERNYNIYELGPIKVSVNVL
jgi:hypothetical protein